MNNFDTCAQELTLQIMDTSRLHRGRLVQATVQIPDGLDAGQVELALRRHLRQTGMGEVAIRVTVGPGEPRLCAAEFERADLRAPLSLLSAR